ncbi:hypothetical protein GWI34_28305 [Actinomadura sp. DSM 109109]|nr:hypothetical protein [Actinomadura lepetitiana]
MVGDDVVAVLHAVADAFRRRDREAVERCVDLLEFLRTRPFTPEQTRRHREIVREHRLLLDSDMLEQRRQIQLYQALLRVAYAGVLSVAHLEQIEEDAGTIQGLLLRTLENYPGADAVVNLMVAVRCTGEGRRRILDRLDGEALVEAAAREPLRVAVFDAAFHELVRRLDEEEDDSAVVPLCRYAYLSHPLRRRFPNDEHTQFDWLTKLLTAAYGERLDVKEFEEVVDGSRTPRPTTALFGTALFLYGDGPDPRELLLSAYFGRMVGASTLGPEVIEYLDAVLAGGHLEIERPRPRPSPAPPRVLARLAQKFRLGHGTSAASQPGAHTGETQVPPSFGGEPGPGEPPPEGGQTAYDGRGPWMAFSAVVVFLLVFTLLVIVTASWWSPEPPPP